MDSRNIRKISYYYLLLIPIISAGLGFGVGPVSYQIYLPLWLVNVVLMLIASWQIGLKFIKKNSLESTHLAVLSFFLVAPWLFISIFAGMGPPPESGPAWVANITEQQVRYSFLVVCGVLIVLGFGGISEILKKRGESFYSKISFVAISVAIPLFIINMLFWGFYLSQYFKIKIETSQLDHPEWFTPIRELFGMISIVEVALTYLATLTMSIALKNVGWLSSNSAKAYQILSSLALVVIISSPIFPEFLQIPGFALSIPAIPFIMPFYLGLNLLWKVGTDTIRSIN